jgi:hypothetical protein
MARTTKKNRGKASQKKRRTSNAQPLKGWQQIAEFLGQPVSVAQRWAKTGMPAQRQGRFVTANPDELNKWLGREAGGEPLHVATPEADLSAELKRGLAYVRGRKARGQPQ